MSNGATASYYFLPWVRYGLTQTLAGPTLGKEAFRPGPASVTSRVTLDGAFSLKLNEEEVPFPNMALHGPGDVVGIDPREIVRTMPRSQTPDFPPHLFPFVEFDRPDFPWLFTPGNPDGEGALRPWLVLVVLPKNLATLDTNPNQPLPTLRCSLAELPDLDESWAWAHAQYVGKPGLDKEPKWEQLRAELTSSPVQNVSRLLCPRRLEPNKGGENGYVACLVPAFENGRKAGLGQAPGNDLAPAWKSDVAGEVTLPVYYQWEFGTGIEQDFEEMIDRLTFLEALPPTSSGAPLERGLMDVSQPGAPIPEQRAATLPIVTALSWPKANTTPADPQILEPLKKALAKALNNDQSSPSDERPAIMPPAYGRWHGAGAMPWFRTLNLDPRYRVAAGLGTQVIRDQQESLVAAAWEQAAKVREANQWLRQQQLARAVTTTIRDKRLNPLKIDLFFQLTGALNPVGEGTLVQSVLSGSFRRMLRPRGPLARRLRAAGKPVEGLLTSIKDEEAPRDSRPLESEIINKWNDQKHDSLKELNPERLFNEKVTRRIQLSEHGRRKTLLDRGLNGSDAGDPLEPELIGPTFLQPMYEPLRELFQEMLLPGIDRIPNNSVGLLASNSAFIEAYLVGLNHEMSRELLWREFPAHLGHTYFQQFWDVSGAAMPSPDIEPLSKWTGDLGTNVGSGRGDLTFLLIRGDLLLRYPNTLIYAEQAEWLQDLPNRKSDANVVFPTLRMHPVPGMTLLGFDLDLEDDGKVSRKNPGWFFIFEEPPTDTRFGLDISRDGKLTRWRELTWDDVTVRDDYLSLKADAKTPTLETTDAAQLELKWNKNGAHMAYITLQKAYRLLVHSSVWFGYKTN